MTTASSTTHKHHDHTEQHGREFSDEDRRQSFETEDRRWSRGSQLRDWLVLGVMIAISLGYHLVIYLVQPGLR